MSYEDSVKDLVYNKDRILDYKDLFKGNQDWYFKYLAENAGIWDLWYYWNELKDNWKDIQNYLPYWSNSWKRICPICGGIFIKEFNRHLNYCGLNREKYVLMIFNLDEVPKCKNPNCNNKVGLHGRGYTFRDFCSRACENLYRLSIGTHNWLSENRLKDENGKDIMSMKGYRTQIVNGTHNFVCRHQLSRTSMWGWHSYPEDLLGDILFLLNIDYLREYRVVKLPSGQYKYRGDYYLPEYNTILECDGMYKWDEFGNLLQEYLDRKHEIQEVEGIKVINIPSNDIFYYKYNKRELYKLINKVEEPLVKYS